MKKKLIFGCVGAAILIVFASFNSVVSVQTIDSTTKESPLFGLRTRRVLSRLSDKLTTYDYVGRGKLSTIVFPRLNDKQLLLDKVIDKLGKMNDEEFNNFVNLFIRHASKDNVVKEGDISKAVDSLNYLRDNPEELKEAGSTDLYITDDCLISVGCLIGLLIFIFTPLKWLYVILMVYRVLTLDGSC